jgi:hypothetical protein
VRYGRHCEHEFIDASTGAPVEPIVNVFADAGRAACMTLGRKYRCVHCRRIVDLRARARLPLPESPLDSRTLDPLVAANDAQHEVGNVPAECAGGASPRDRIGAAL